MALFPDWNRHDPIFAGHLDLEKIGAFGYSLGGNPAAEFGRTDPRFRAVALLDCFLQGFPLSVEKGLPVPVFQLFRDENMATSDAIAALESTPVVDLFRHTRTNAYLCQVKGTVHLQFKDLYTSDRASKSGRLAEEALRACLVSFFKRHLKGEDDAFLEAPTAAFPAIFYFKKK